MVDYIKSLTPLTPSGRARVLFSMSAHSPAPRRGPPCSPIASGFDFWSATFVFQDLRLHTHAQIAGCREHSSWLPPDFVDAANDVEPWPDTQTLVSIDTWTLPTPQTLVSTVSTPVRHCSDTFRHFSDTQNGDYDS